MRNTFAQVLTELAEHNANLVLLYADTGNRLFNPLKKIAAERTINVGIAEANMVSVSAGLAANGHQPLTYAISAFTSSRNFEQIKIDIAYQNLPVVIVGTGSGLAYANLGPTHHTFEDIALMRVLPNMQIVCPADSVELRALLPQVIASKKPTYFRIGKKNEPDLVDENNKIVLGQPNRQVAGSDVLIITTGLVLALALKAQKQLASQGISCEVVSLHTIKPLNHDYLTQAAARFSKLVTIEEHSLVGGMGSAIVGFLADHQLTMQVQRFGIKDEFLDRLADQESGWQATGLTVENIVSGIKKWF